MGERIHPSDRPWQLYGDQYGGKIHGLYDLQMRRLPDIKVASGIAIGASYFREFLEINGFDQNTPDKKFEFKKTKIPPELQVVQKQILSTIPVGSAVFIRSSATDEQSGNGIYSSEILVRTGNEATDLQKFSEAIKIIYGSYNSEDAIAFRKRVGLAYGGMGLGVQQLYGDRIGNLIYPQLSGVLQFMNGVPKLSVCNGLGVGVVAKGDSVVLRHGDISVEKLDYILHAIKKGEAMNLSSHEIVDVVNANYLDHIRGILPKMRLLIDTWNQLNERGNPMYWEFAITEEDSLPIILQSNKNLYEQKLLQMPEIKGKIICDGTDVVNEGIKEGTQIVVIDRNFNPEVLGYLHEFNQKNIGYLLFLPDTLLSRVSRGKLRFKDFSNAQGVIELQFMLDSAVGYISGSASHAYDNMGGTHFLGLCKDTNILFLGHPLHSYETSLVDQFGKPDEKFGENLYVWNRRYRMINSQEYGRVELL